MRKRHGAERVARVVVDVEAAVDEVAAAVERAVVQVGGVRRGGRQQERGDEGPTQRTDGVHGTSGDVTAKFAVTIVVPANYAIQADYSPAVPATLPATMLILVRLAAIAGA